MHWICNAAYDMVVGLFTVVKGLLSRGWNNQHNGS